MLIRKYGNRFFIVLLFCFGNTPSAAYGALNPSNFVDDLNDLILEG